MTLPLSDRALLAAQQVNIEPQLVLKIEGYDPLFGVRPVQSFIRVGDPGLEIGNDWVIGGVREMDDERQKALISLSGTTTAIGTQLAQDRGGYSSIAQFDVALIDKNELITQLVSPGAVLSDILMRQATVYLGLQGTSFPEDYVKIFRGPITDVVGGPGIVTLSICHPDKKKQQKIFQPGKTTLGVGIDELDTTITLTSVPPEFLVPPADVSLRCYVRIGDELIEYTGISGNDLTGCVRGALNTSAEPHDADADVETLFRLQGDMIELTLKLMLSGVNGNFVEEVESTNFVTISGTESNAQAIFFKGVNVFEEYGLTAGDLMSVIGADNGANNFTDRTITSVVETDDGSYIVVDGSPLVVETDTDATCAFRSQYDTLGTGLQMKPDEVDIAEHLRLGDFVGSGIPEYDFFIKEEIDGKDFIEKELLYPAAFYVIPRKSRSSLGATLPPLPVEGIKILDSTNVVKPKDIKIKRSVSRNFYNTIVYQYDESPTEDRFFGGTVAYSADSRNRIPYGNKVMTIKSKGLRSSNNGALIASLASERLLNRYKFAAEYIEGVRVHFRAGFNVEIGDIVVFGDALLQVMDTKTASRAFVARAFEVVNMKLDIKGSVMLDLVDTGFSVRGRFGVVGPSSTVQAGSTSSSILITESYGRTFPEVEYAKWQQYVGTTVKVHHPEWTYSGETTFMGLDPGNPYRMILSPPLEFTPAAGDIVTMPDYAGTAANNQIWKLLHTSLAPQVAVDSGASSTEFDVGSGDVDKFFVGCIVRVHSDDYVDDSGECRVTAIDGTTLTVENLDPDITGLGFTPDNTHLIDYIGFASDRGDFYRYTQ